MHRSNYLTASLMGVCAGTMSLHGVLYKTGAVKITHACLIGRDQSFELSGFCFSIFISLTGNRVLRLPCECASSYLKHRIHIFTFKQ